MQDINKYKISVILPVYNGACTLDKCIQSVLGQTYENCELICIDDGSTDRSGEICMRYADRDNRCRVIFRKNGGVASARNTGLGQAQGDYITFIDQDDWLETKAYSCMMAKLKEQTDVLIFGYFKDYTDRTCKMQNKNTVDMSKVSTDRLIQYAFRREEYRNFGAFIWNKIFRRDLLLKNRIVFDDSLRRGDDVLFYTQVALAADSAVYTERNFYHYVQREDSVTHTKNAGNLSVLSDILVGYEKAIHLLEKDENCMEGLKWMKRFYTYHAMQLCEIALKEKQLEKAKCYAQKIEKYKQFYIMTNLENKDRLHMLENILQQCSSEGR